MGFPHFDENVCSGGDINRFSPFRYWCYNILPLIFDDSLSQYEILCKVTDSLNKIGADTNTLSDLTSCLSSFADDMQTHLNNFIDDYNSEITTINERLDAGGFSATVVQTTGNSTSDIMSQKACTDSFMPIGGGGGGNFMANGSVPMTGNLNMNSKKIINVGTPTANTDAATKQYVDTHGGAGDLKADGSVPMTGNLNMNSKKIVNVADPTATKDAANKIYADKHIGGNVLDVSVAPVNGQIIKFDGSTNKWVYSAETGGGTGGGGDFLSNGTVPMTGNLNMNTKKVINVGTPTENGDAATKLYVDTHSGAGDFKANGSVAMTGNLNMGSHKVVNLLSPTTGTDAVNKTYADTNILGMGIKDTTTFPKADGYTLRWKESENGWVWYPLDNKTYINNHIAGKDIDSALTPADGQIIKWDDVHQKWVYADEAGTGGGVGNVVQRLGFSESDVMSQNATTRWALWAPAESDFSTTETRPIMSSYILHPELITYGNVQLTGMNHWFHKLIGEQGSKPWNTIGNATAYMEGFPIPMYNGEAAGHLGLLADTLYADSTFTITKIGNGRKDILKITNTEFNVYNNPITNVSAPTNNTDAANKKYVDDADATVKSYGNTHIAGKTAPTGTPTAGQTITWDATNSKWVYSTPSGGGGTYTLPKATASALGGIKANAAQSGDTQEVRIDANGFLKTAPGTGGGGTSPTVVQTTGTSTTSVMSQKAVSDTFLKKANINDTLERVTAVTGVNPGTENYYILAKNFDDMAEDRIPIYNAENTLNVNKIRGDAPLRIGIANETNDIEIYAAQIAIQSRRIRNMLPPIEFTDAANKEYVDGISHTALPASNTSLTVNAVYKPTTAVGTYVFNPPNTGWAHGIFTTDEAPAITFAAGSKFANAVPTFEASTEYEFDVYDKVWVFAKVVTA